MFFVEFIGENLDLLSAFGAIADEGFQAFELFETWTVPRGTHLNLLLSENER